MKKKYLLLFIICVISVIAAPIILTRNGCLITYNANTGVVGDTIGGLTAPVVGLISIFLLIYTLIKQNESSERQIRFMRDEKFENTLFNLLTEQRDIAKSLTESFHGLSNNDASKKIITRIYGNECFAMAEYELRQLFSSLESDYYYNHYDPAEVIDTMEYLEDSLLHGCNLPYEEKRYNENKRKEISQTALHAYYNDLFNISSEEYEKYRNLNIQKKIQFVYSKFFQRRTSLGHYFRHLYHILLLINNTEKEEQDKIQSVTRETSDKYWNYAQFVQAQMSQKELLLLFYNSFCYPKMMDLIKKYDLLENLDIESLFSENHNCIPEYHLKHRIH